METGIYYGFASVDGGPVYKMVMSIGWNPFYKNVKKSMVLGFLKSWKFSSCTIIFAFRKHTYCITLSRISMEVFLKRASSII